MLDRARGGQRRGGVLGDLRDLRRQALGHVLIRCGQRHDRQGRQVLVAYWLSERRAHVVGHRSRGAGRQRGVRPHVDVEAVLLGGGARTRERDLRRIAEHRHPWARQAIRRHGHEGVALGAAGDRGLHGDVARVSVSALRRHTEGRAVVHVHRRDAHALVLRQVGHGQEGLVLQVRRVVAERGQRRGVGLNVEGRVHEVAAHDARAAGTEEFRGGQRDADGHREDGEGTQQARADVHGRTRLSRGSRLATTRGGTTHEDVLPQRDALVLGGQRPPGGQERPPGQHGPHGQRVAREAEKHRNNAHEDERDRPEDRASGAGGDQAREDGAHEATHPRHEGRARVDRHGGRQGQQVLPRAEGTQHHDLQRLAGGQESVEGLGAQGGRAAQQEVCDDDAQDSRQRVPAPARRGGGDQQAAGHARARGDRAHSPAEDRLESRDRAGEQQGEDEQRPDRQARTERREALCDRQQTIAGGPGLGCRRLARGDGRLILGCGLAALGRLHGRGHGLVLGINALSAGLSVDVRAHARPPATIMRGRSSSVEQSRSTPRPRSRRARTPSAPIRMMETGTSIGARRAR